MALAAAVVASEARAGGSIEDAKQWVAEGDKAQDAGDCATAIGKYRQALSVKETAQIYLRVGACQETTNQLLDALQTYKVALPMANEKVKPLVEERIAAVTPRVPGVTLILPAKPLSDVRVTVNGAPVADLTHEVSVNAGPLEIRAVASGMLPFTKTLQIAPGEHQRVEVAFSDVVDDLPIVTPPSDTPGPRPSVPGIVLGAVGVVGIGVSIGLIVRGFGLQSELEDEGKCVLTDQGYQCPADSPISAPQDYVDSSNAFKGAGWVTLGVGAASATVGGVLLGLSLSAKPKAATPPVAVFPVLSPRVVGVGALGSF